MAVPRLRFKADNGSEFPEWEEKTLGELGKFIKGAPLSKADTSEGGLPIILYGELYTTYKEVAYDIKNHTNVDIDKKYLSQIGDIVIPTSGETAKEISTATCVMKEGVVLAGDLYIYRISNNINGQIMSYLFNHQINKDIARIAQGKSIVHIQANELCKLVVQYPRSVFEQKKIVDCLSTLDIIIKNCQSEVETWEKYKRGVMQQLFSQKMRFKTDDGNEYPEWETKTLKDCCDCLDNMRKPVTKSDRKPGPFPYYGSTDIQDYVDDYIFDEPLVLLTEDAGPFNDFATKPIAQYAEGKYWVNNHAHVLRPHGNRKYMFYALVHKDIRMYINSPDRGKLNQKSMDKIEVPYPCLEEQQKIADCLSAFDEVIDKAKQKLEAYKQLKKGLLQQMFV